MTPRRTNQAFTLTELLVVIGVIGILASLILSALASAKSKARQSYCAHNVGQLGLALQEFVTDYHVYPRLVSQTEEDRTGEHSTGWGTALEKVMVPSFDPLKPDPANRTRMTSGVWLCPSAPRPADWPEQYGYPSYGYNGRGMGEDEQMLGLATAWFGPGHVNDSVIVSPSDMLAIGDAFQGAFENGILLDGGGLNRGSGAVPNQRLYGGFVNVNECTKRAYSRHSGKANMVFCDGHTAALTLNSLFIDTSDASLERWNRDHQPHRDLLSNK